MAIQPEATLSWQSYASLPQDPRAEYVDGSLLVSPSPTQKHQKIALRLAALLTAASPPGWSVNAGWAWKPGDDEFIPDVMVYPDTDEQARFTGTPLLAVEILSSNRADDLVLKSARYARAGLPHYWIVDPRDQTLTAYDLDAGGCYRHQAHLVIADDAPAAPSTGRLLAGPITVDVDLTALLAR